MPLIAFEGRIGHSNPESAHTTHRDELASLLTLNFQTFENLKT